MNDRDKQQRKFEEARKSRTARMAGNIASGLAACGLEEEDNIAERAVSIAQQIDDLIYGKTDRQ